MQGTCEESDAKVLNCRPVDQYRGLRALTSDLGLARGSRRRSWRETLAAYRHPRVVTMLFLGFSAGLPLLLIFSSLSLWLREAGVDRATVTYFSWAALGYGFKFVWAPIIDKMPLPYLTARLGRRRAWLLTAQVLIICAIVWMASTDPAHGITTMGVAAVMLGFCAATQDIVIDAYRIESAEKALQALMSSTYIVGYRIGMLVSGAGALKLAVWLGDVAGYRYSAWQGTYLWMAAAMGVGVITTLLIPEPAEIGVTSRHMRSLEDYLRFLALFSVMVATLVAVFALGSATVEQLKQRAAEAGHHGLLAGFLLEAVHLGIAFAVAWLAGMLAVRIGVARGEVLRETYLEPLADFFYRYGGLALLILALIGLYRVSDVVLGVISNVFYQDLGFTKDQIADITKTFGLLMTILGGLLGGGLALRFGVMRMLFLGALLSAGTNLLFVLLAHRGAELWLLAAVISADNISGGLAGAAFVAYLSGLTQVSFTAFQYALFSSLMLLFPKLLGGYSGSIVDALGYSDFFILTALMGVPVLVLILLAARYAPAREKAPDG